MLVLRMDYHSLPVIVSFIFLLTFGKILLLLVIAIITVIIDVSKDNQLAFDLVIT